MTDLWLDSLGIYRFPKIKKDPLKIDFRTVYRQYQALCCQCRALTIDLWTVYNNGFALIKLLCTSVPNSASFAVKKSRVSAVRSRKTISFKESSLRGWERASRSNLFKKVNCEGVRTSQKILSIAQSQIGVREATGKNDGQQVEQYLQYVGFKKGNPWCAAFVSWVFGQAGFKSPRSAWSPALFPAKRLTKNIQAAIVFGIYFPDLKRIAHCGLVEKQQGHWLRTIEGNTNVAGSREGDGVYRKLRHTRSIYAYANWLAEEGGKR